MGFKERKPIQEIGKTYDRWTILDVVSRTDSTGNPRYKAVARCVCGTEKEVDLGSIRYGATKSCGCLQRERATGRRSIQCPGFEEISSATWRHWKYNAAKKGLDFNLNIEDIWDLYIDQERRCAISRVPIVFGNTVDQKLTTVSLDRIENDQGYLPNNVQLVHKRINFMRHAMDVEDFISWCHVVAQNQPNPERDLTWQFITKSRNT